MGWTEPVYPRSRVDAAGRVWTRRPTRLEELDEAFDILNNWRASHAFPLNTFQTTLRKRARRFDSEALVAQRLKRFPSIIQKLRRYPRMRLSQMQDIGGCRTVLTDVRAAQDVRDSFLTSRSRHELVGVKDYVKDPKASGYRGYHLVYRYRSQKIATYNDLLIEVQIRSQVQHAWATAVETVGTLLGRALKSSEGPEQWLQFFTLISSAFAAVELTPAVPGTPPMPELLEIASAEAEVLRVRERLRTYRAAVQALEGEQLREASYYLLTLWPAEELLEISGFDTLESASSAYLEQERATGDGAEVVLVRSDSLEALQRAYPNYFLDTEMFLGQLDAVLFA